MQSTIYGDFLYGGRLEPTKCAHACPTTSEEFPSNCRLHRWRLSAPASPFADWRLSAPASPFASAFSPQTRYCKELLQRGSNLPVFIAKKNAPKYRHCNRRASRDFSAPTLKILIHILGTCLFLCILLPLPNPLLPTCSGESSDDSLLLENFCSPQLETGQSVKYQGPQKHFVKNRWGIVLVIVIVTRRQK